jgi:hypothetical protein
LIDDTLSTYFRWHGLSRKACLLIFQTESRHHFLGLAHVFRHFMILRKDIAYQFHEIVVAIVREEILGLNGHQSSDEGKNGHFCVFMQRLF